MNRNKQHVCATCGQPVYMVPPGEGPVYCTGHSAEFQAKYVNSPLAAFEHALRRMTELHAELMAHPHSEALAAAYHLAAIDARRAFDVLADVAYRSHREARERRTA